MTTFGKFCATVFALGVAFPAFAQDEVIVEVPASVWFGGDLRGQLIATGVLFILLYLLHRMLVRHAAGMEGANKEVRRRLIVGIRNGAIGFMLLGLVVIWATELRTVAVSVVAITAAIVIATKELILCVSGGFYRTLMGACKVGDLIELNGMRGQVIDTTMFSTTILEIGPGQLTHQQTGRAIVIPNGLLLSSPLINETYTRDFVAHTFQVPVAPEEDWEEAERILLAAAKSETADFIDKARAYMDNLEHTTALAIPSADSRVILRLPEPDKLFLIVRITVPPARRGRIEQAIMRRFLREFRKKEEVVQNADR